MEGVDEVKLRTLGTLRTLLLTPLSCFMESANYFADIPKFPTRKSSINGCKQQTTQRRKVVTPIFSPALRTLIKCLVTGSPNTLSSGRDI